MDVHSYMGKYRSMIEKAGVITASGSLNYKLDKSLLTACDYDDNMSILDYGCGWGALLEITQPNTYTGVDISKEMIDEARIRFPNMNFKVMDIGQLDVGEHDFIVAHSVFTHVPKSILKFVLKDIHQNLIDTGKALVDIYYRPTNDEMTEYYTHDEWLGLLKTHGFNGEYIQSFNRSQNFIHNYYKIRKAT